jgi:GTPase-associated system helical domain
MSQSILQAFLNEHIITIDTNDEFTLLQKAALEFEKRLRNKKQRVSQVAQVAFDPAVKSTEPLVAEVQELITSKWKAFPSKCQNKPIPYVRAVMLAALQKLSEEVNFAGIIWLTVTNYFPFTEITQREATILRELLSEIGNTYQQASWKNWSIDNSYKETKLREIATVPITSANKINQEFAPKKMLSAVKGSADGDNKNAIIAYSYSNRYNGNTENKEAEVEDDWAKSFSSIAGGALTSVANQLTADINKALVEAASLKQLTAYTEAITGYLREVGESMSRQTASHNLRSQLLWVKESMYSTGQKTSYRKLPLALLPLALASDAADMVPEVYPISIDFFLRETLADANATTDSTSTFEQLLAELPDEQVVVQATLPAHQPEPGRISLLAFVSAMAASTAQLANFEQSTGLRLSDTISRQEFGVWIFRELQVLKLAAAK